MPADASANDDETLVLDETALTAAAQALSPADHRVRPSRRPSVRREPVRPRKTALGSNPIPASSGKSNRHRLNRGGDRQANAALWRIAIVRMRSDPDTRTYVDKRIKEGRSKTEAIRCLKRYFARELYAKLPREALA